MSIWTQCLHISDEQYIQYNTIYNTIQDDAIQYNAIQCITMHCNAMQYKAIYLRRQVLPHI